MVLKEGWSLIRLVFNSSGFPLVKENRNALTDIRVVSHQLIFDSPRFALVKENSKHIDRQTGRSFIGVTPHHDGLSLGWSLVRLVFHSFLVSAGQGRYKCIHRHQGSLSSGWSVIGLVFA